MIISFFPKKRSSSGKSFEDRLHFYRYRLLQAPGFVRVEKRWFTLTVRIIIYPLAWGIHSNLKLIFFDSESRKTEKKVKTGLDASFSEDYYALRH